MPAPKPAQRVRGSATGRPIMALLDLLGRRMTLRILWELRDQNLTFRALQEAAETNPSVLNVRLKELREAQLVAHEDNGYGLTRTRQGTARNLPAAARMGRQMGAAVREERAATMHLAAWMQSELAYPCGTRPPPGDQFSQGTS